MPKIDDLIIRRIKDIAKIEDVVGEFVTLRKMGVNMTGLCPFHDDQTDGNFIVRPSTVSADRGGNTYHCFVCMGRGEGGGPIDFLMRHEKLSYPDAIRWLGRKYHEPVDDVPFNYVPPPPRPKPKPKPPLPFKRETVKQSMRGIEQTYFVQWLFTLPWSNEQRERLWHTLYTYCVATCPHGHEWISFWQISHEGIPITAKYMKYHPDGHRVKDKLPDGTRVFASDWEHAWRARMKQYDPDKYDTSKRALFGAHLLKAYPQAPVNVVESEKTAIIMANYYGDPERGLWLACGGLNWLNLDSMQPLIDQQRTVWLWPDRDGVEKWQQVCDKLGADNVRVYTDFFRTSYVPEDDGPKADIADIAIRLMSGGRLPEQTHTGDPQPPTRVGTGGCAAATPDPSDQPPDGVLPDEWLEHQAIMRAIKEWQLEHAPDEPFLDPIELQDPRVHEWRQRLRLAYNFNKTKRKQPPNNERPTEE